MADKSFVNELVFKEKGLDGIASLFDAFTKNVKTSVVQTSKLQKEQEKLAKTNKANQDNLKSELALNEKILKKEQERYQLKLKSAREFREKGFDPSSLAHPVKSLGKMFSSVRSSMNSVLSGKIDDKISERDANAERIEELKKLSANAKKKKDKAGYEKEIADLMAKNKGLSKDIKGMGAAQFGMNTAVNLAVSSAKAFGKAANKVFKTMGIDLKSIMGDVITNITKMLSTEGIASYNMGSSIFTNSSARETQMKYGLSSGQAYALTQTMSMLNMRTDEDLMYMNKSQKEVFNQLMDKYDAWYTEFQNSGAAEELQKAQLEFSMFKQELSYKLLNWFAANRDTIMTVLEGIMGLMQFTANVVSGILGLFGKKVSTSSASTSDYTSSSYGNRSINVNVSNTNNATANFCSSS